MHITFNNESKLDPGIYAHIFEKVGKIKVGKFVRMSMEFDRSFSPEKNPLIGEEYSMQINIGGSPYKDTITAEIRKQEYRLRVYDIKRMKTHGWKPVYNSNRKQILAWTKTPYMVFCIDLNGIPMNTNTKQIVNKLLRIASSMKSIPIKLANKTTYLKLKDMLDSGRKKQIEDVERDIGSRKSNVKSYLANLADEHARLNKLASDKRRLERKPDKTIDVKKMVKSTLAIKGVEAVGVQDNKVVVITKPLTAKWKDGDNTKVVNIGAYNISWGIGDKITIRNLWKRPNYCYDHPHVDNGNPCWGNMGEITEMAQSFQIDVVVQLILAYLQNIGEGHPYEDAATWLANFMKERR